MSRKIPAWIYMDTNTSEMFCKRCGQREKVPLPMSVTAFGKWAEYMGERHRFCKEPAKEITPSPAKITVALRCAK